MSAPKKQHRTAPKDKWQKGRAAINARVARMQAAAKTARQEARENAKGFVDTPEKRLVRAQIHTHRQQIDTLSTEISELRRHADWFSRPDEYDEAAARQLAGLLRQQDVLLAEIKALCEQVAALPRHAVEDDDHEDEVQDATALVTAPSALVDDEENDSDDADQDAQDGRPASDPDPDPDPDPGEKVESETERREGSRNTTRLEKLWAIWSTNRHSEELPVITVPPRITWRAFYARELLKLEVTGKLRADTLLAAKKRRTKIAIGVQRAKAAGARQMVVVIRQSRDAAPSRSPDRASAAQRLSKARKLAVIEGGLLKKARSEARSSDRTRLNEALTKALLSKPQPTNWVVTTRDEKVSAAARDFADALGLPHDASELLAAASGLEIDYPAIWVEALAFAAYAADREGEAISHEDELRRHTNLALIRAQIGAENAKRETRGDAPISIDRVLRDNPLFDEHAGEAEADRRARIYAERRDRLSSLYVALRAGRGLARRDDGRLFLRCVQFWRYHVEALLKSGLARRQMAQSVYALIGGAQPIAGDPYDAAVAALIGIQPQPARRRR